MAQSELTYSVPGMSCETKQVAVRGDDLNDQAVRAAIHEAGYDVAG
jgi:copper chaperone CopZ